VPGDLPHAAPSALADGAPADPSAVVVAAGVIKRYGTNVVLDGTDLVVRRGVTGLLGANGAGKTTLLGLLLGLHRRDGGALSVLGADPVAAGPEVRARIGYSPEHHNLPPDLPANDFVQHVAEVHGLPRAEAVGRASDALWFVGMGEERMRPLGTLSTGQRQRVKLAQAIAHDPELVILDEPTDGLDPTQRETMLALIRRLASDFGMSVLLSSHLLDEVERTCSEVVILNGGRVTAAGGLDELRGEGRGVTVEVDGDRDALVAAWREVGLDVVVDGPRLVVTRGPALAHLDQAEVLRLVRDHVAHLGLGLRRLEHRTVSLEDVYLRVGT